MSDGDGRRSTDGARPNGRANGRTVTVEPEEGPRLRPDAHPQPGPSPAPPRPARRPYLAERLGIGPGVEELLYHPVPAKTSPLDYLGFLTLFAFVNQVVTGTLLATAYRPTVAEAYASVRSLMASPAGTLVRGLHYWGANAMVVLVVLHLLRVFFIGAYKPPREFTWVSGVLLLGTTIGFAFTGYLLPWDQKAYWATVVGTAMAGYAPWVGTAVTDLLRGGTSVTGATLTRFYAAHLLLLPALLLVVLGLHFALVLAHGVTDVEARLPRGYRAAHRPGDRADFPRGPYVPFWPHTVGEMSGLIAVAAAVLAALAARAPAPLLAAADPLNRAGYRPVPEWYFFALYQFLKYLPGRLDALGMVGVPLLLGVALVGLPFYDRNPRRAPARRPLAMTLMGVAVALTVALTYLGWRGTQGVSAHETVIAHPVYARDIAPVFAAHCSACHGPATRSGGLDLSSYAALMRGGSSGPVVRPGDPQASLLVEVLEGRAPGGIPPMPLGQQPLPSTTIETIKNWIRDGAKGP